MTVKSSAAQILNTAPVIDSLSVTPSVAYTDTALTCTPSTNDPDRDDEVTFSWEWFVEEPVAGTVVSVGTGETLDSSLFVRDEYVWCAAQADDGESISAWRSSGVLIIQNSRPTAPTVDLGVTEVIEGEPVRCTLLVPGSDADFDGLEHEYRWTLDGAILSDSDNTLDETDDMAGSVVGCSARALEVGEGGLNSDWSVESTAQIIE